MPNSATAAAKRRLSEALAVECGLAVFGEVGSKDAKNDAALLVSQAEDCFAAGAELVLVEAAELIVDGKPKMKLINGLRKGLDMSRVLIELPGPWISNITLSIVEDMKKFLVSEFGPDVNIANVMAADIMETEALRVRQDGSEFWANVQLTALGGDANTPATSTGFLSVVGDVTDRRRAQDVLHQMNRTLAGIIDAAPLAILSLDAASAPVPRRKSGM